MKFYFSGVSSTDEFDMLREANVSRLLVDPVDLPVVAARWKGSLALDCGAYRRYRTGRGPNCVEYLKLARRIEQLDFVTAYEEIGADPERNYEYWRAMVDAGVDAMPVYQWSTSRVWLQRYLDESRVIGAGGLVETLRAKNDDAQKKALLEAQREQVLEDLQRLCADYPGRLHVFGLCWLKGLEMLRVCDISADSSKWLDGRRYRQLIFENTHTGHLSTAPSRAIRSDWEQLDGRALSTENARNMERYLNAARG